MSTPTPPTVSQILEDTGFNTDFKNYENDLSEYKYLHGLSNEVNGKEGPLTQAYNDAYSQLNFKSKNPWLIFIEVMHLLLDPGTNLANNNLDIYGQENKCQSALLQCQNDLQSITTSKKDGSNGLNAEAHGLNKLLGNLHNQGESVFGKGTKALIDNLSTIRSQIFIPSGEEGSTNNPEPDSKSPIYFNPTGASGTMSSYGEMIENLSIPGDPGSAINANTELTNAFNTNTSILQSVSQQSKERLSQWINTVKTLASAGSMISHAISQVSTAAQQNMRPQ